MILTTGNIVTRETPFADLLRQRCGLTLPVDRFAQCLRRLGYEDVESAWEHLRGLPLNSAPWQRLLREFSIGETYFFRGIEPLESALHQIIAQRRAMRTLTIWSAGCATGEEPYTLAMLVRELLPDASWQVTILGTDINESALVTARRAVYGAWSMRGQDSRVRGAFEPWGDRWQVAATVRQMVSFRILNLADEQALYPQADLIVCRNVLMYLEPEVQMRVRGRLSAALNADGVLLLDDARINSAQARYALSTNAFTAVDAGEARRRSASKPAAVRSLSNAAPGARLEGSLPGDSSWYEQARAAADQHNWPEAHRLLDEAPILDLSCAWLRALIYQQQGEIGEAIQALRRCLYIDHKFVLGYFTLGNLYLAQGERRLARQQWANASRLIEGIPADDKLPLGEGITAGEVAQAISSAGGTHV